MRFLPKSIWCAVRRVVECLKACSNDLFHNDAGRGGGVTAEFWVDQMNVPLRNPAPDAPKNVFLRTRKWFKQLVEHKAHDAFLVRICGAVKLSPFWSPR